MSDVVVKKPQHPIVVLRERLEARRGELKNALPSDITPERFIRALVTSAHLNPDLLACTWQSLWLACMRACRDGLLPDGREGAIVPYKSVATWIPMYQGLLKRFRKSGQFKWITANVVRQGETFNHYIDTHGENFFHQPGDDVEAQIVRIYAVATTKDGGFFASVLSISEADKIRKLSRATREDAPWRMWPEEMYKKTALRRLSKMLPMDGEGYEEELEPEPPAIAAMPTPQRLAPAEALDQFAEEEEEEKKEEGSPT